MSDRSLEPTSAFPERMPLLDRHQRPLRDLRISVTDRCNFRCSYCMPRSAFGRQFEFLPHAQVLSFEEIARVASRFVQAGVHKLRITGGEPLLRRELPTLIGMLSDLGRLDLALTTNGSLLGTKARELYRAGLKRVTVSLDALDDALFRELGDVTLPVADVLTGVDRAVEAGLEVKINTVVRRGLNEGQILPLARYFRDRGLTLRFIEFMDVGNTNAWQPSQVLSHAEILSVLRTEFALDPTEPGYPGEVAERFAYRDGAGEVGIIASVTRPFCGSCTRARLSADGRLYTCLFATTGTDLKGLLRAGATDADLDALIARVWEDRGDRYSETRAAKPITLRKIEMSYIGG